MSNPSWTRDELILGLDVYFQLQTPDLSPSHAAIVSLSRFLNSLPLHPPHLRDDRFRNPTGVAMELRTFLQYDPRYPGRGLARGSRLGAQVWQEFTGDTQRLRETANAIRASLPDLAVSPAPTGGYEDDPDDSFPEGILLTRLHRIRERNATAVARKKASVLTATGTLACEACDFDFYEGYGDVGRGFIECHHVLPLRELARQRRTRLEDLALVCSNCHRMLHRVGSAASIAGLRTMIAERAMLTSENRGAT